MGSRYGGGIKQLEKVGPSGEIIMDYSIYDAKAAGFDRVVFITRRDLEKEFRAVIGKRVEEKIETEYVFQELSNLPEGFLVPEGREKPWGTGHAVLSCLSVVKEPFAVINADDYYGREAFVKVHDFLVSADIKEKGNYCMAGFILGNTLSENGVVTRGVCDVDSAGYLKKVVETFKIAKDGERAVGESALGEPVILPLTSAVSMNMWGLTPDFLPELKTGFVDFLKNGGIENIKSEYLLPQVIDTMIQQKRARVQVLETPDKWFGVTYREDKDAVISALQELIKKGVYPEKL